MWWLSLALAGPCADADLLAPADLRDELEALWSTSDDRAFRTGMAAVDSQLSCIAEPVEPLDVARLHRNQAQLALASGDERGARRALASMARVADGTDTPEVDDGWLAAA